MILAGAAITNCPAQNTQISKSFKTYLEPFKAISLPVKKQHTNNFDMQKDQIPEVLVKKYIDPTYSKSQGIYVAIARISCSSKTILLLIGSGSWGAGIRETYLMVYNNQGVLQQKLLFERSISVRHSLTGSISKQLFINLTSQSLDLQRNTNVTEIFQFILNYQGLIETINEDKFEYLEDMTPAGQMIKQAKAYYGSLDKGNYSLISLYFAPKVHQWLTLKNTNGDKIATEADRFISTKRNVYYAPLFSKVKTKGNALTFPVKLGWNNYQTNVIATITFNNRYEITSLQEKAK